MTEAIFLIWALSTKDSPTKAIAATSVPMRIKGVRLPSLLLCRSEIAPKSGSINRASTLSRAIIAPEAVWERPNLLVRISGMVLS